MIIAFDPGMKGAMAWGDRSQIYVKPFPLAGKDLDLNTLSQHIEATGASLAVIEKVHSMPKQGVSSTFKFGKGYGSILGILAGLQIPVELVTPQAWKKVVLAGSTKDKDAAIAYCRRRFPDLPIVPERCRKPHDGICDALCLLEYGLRNFGDFNA